MIQINQNTVRWIIIASLLLSLILIPFFLLEETLTNFIALTLSGKYSRHIIAICAFIFLVFDVLLPIPSSVVSTLTGGLLGFLHGVIVVWAGMTVGCVVAYWIGANAGARLAGKIISPAEIKRTRVLSGTIGFAVLIVSRGVPVLAEASTIAAGIFGYPFRKFILITSLSNFAIATIYTGIGAYAFEVNAFLLSFIASVLLPLVFWLIYQIYISRTDHETPRT